jgi:hypothetical protein
MTMDDVKIGEILLPGDEATQDRREKQVRAKFWPTLKRAVRYVPLSRDAVAAYYCAVDPKTPTRVRGWRRLPISFCRSTSFQTCS